MNLVLGSANVQFGYFWLEFRDTVLKGYIYHAGLVICEGGCVPLTYSCRIDVWHNLNFYGNS